MIAKAHSVAAQVIGLPETESVQIVEDAGFEARIVERDGTYYPVTRDYREDRVNLYFRDGLVYRASVD
jgi:hypothetical protein